MWEKRKGRRTLTSFTLELTARCNNNCRHCYINIPASDKAAKERELSLEEISGIADEAVSLGALWCQITGGEPLLRGDFQDIYLSLKKKGLLVSVLTNACLITREHVSLFNHYPPRDIEVTVYGVTEDTYGNVTRSSASYSSFIKGVNLLIDSGLRLRLKTMALRSNLHELPRIADFCRERTKDYFRFDPFLHLRFDGNPVRNREIQSERLSPEEIVSLEMSDPERFRCLEEKCDELIGPEMPHDVCNHLFHCGTGKWSCVIGFDGVFRLCSSLFHPDCVYDLKNGSLTDALSSFVPRIRNMRSDRREFLENCRRCSLVNLCMWCPAYAHLETGELDTPIEYFCRVAHARAEALSAV